MIKMGICKTCRFKGDKIADLQPSPDGFRLKLGQYSEMYGHDAAHKEIARLYDQYFETVPLDRFIAA